MRVSENEQEQQEFNKVLPSVALVSFMFLTIYLMRSVFGPLLVFFEQEFSLTHSQSTTFLLDLSIGHAVSTLFSAFTCTFIQPRHMVPLITAAAGAVVLCLTQQTSPEYFSFLFVLLGLATGQYFNPAFCVMRSLVQPKDWAKAVAIHEFGPNVSFIIGPVLAGFVALQYGWRTLLNGVGVFAICSALFFVFSIKGGRRIPEVMRFQGIKDMVNTKMFWLSASLFIVGVCGEFAPYSVLGLHMTSAFQMETDVASTVLAVSRIAPPFALFFSGWIARRFDCVKSIKVCLLVFAVSLLMMATPWLPVALVGIFVQPIAVTLIFPPIFVFLSENFSLSAQPTALAFIMPLSSLLGNGVLPQLMGICGDLVNFNLGFFILALLVFSCLFAMMRSFPATGKHNKQETL